MSVTRTVTTFNPEVTVNTTTDGEFLSYTLTPAGGTPAFAYACADRDPISRADQFPGHPRTDYEWKLQKTGQALPLIVATDRDKFETYTIAMSFLGTVRYALTINLCNRDGSVKTEVQKISYASTDSKDFIAEGLRVLCI